MSIKILLTGLVGLIAFFWVFSMSTQITATSLENDNPLKQIFEEFSSNSQTLSLVLIAVVIIGGLLTKSLTIAGLSMTLVLVIAWTQWV